MAATAEYIVVGHFRFLDDTLQAIGKLRDAGFSEKLEVFSPFPCHDLDDEIYLGKKRSPVRRFTLLGGLTGCLGAFLMTSWMSMDWPLRTSAKSILSYPAFVVIAFECTILLAGIFTLLSMFHFSKIPNLFSKPGFRPEFSNGTFGVTVRVEKNHTQEFEEKLKKWGAEKVEVQYVR